MPTNPRSRRRKFGRLIVILILGGCALVTFGISARDEAAYFAFDESVDRWQANPEFRTVAVDYAISGSRAMRTRPLFIAAKTTIMALRSAPGLPAKYAVNPTSREHYEDFTRGPLSAYLHLCSEQDVPDMVGVIETAGRHQTPDDLRSVLDGYHMDFPVTHDAGALASVAQMLKDADAGKPFTIRTNIGPLLAGPIAQIAAEIHVPARPQEMTADEQGTVLDRLDPYLKAHDTQLWRTKQVSDFCGGVWAQVFSPPYRMVMSPILIAKEICRWTLFGGLLAVVLTMRRRWRASIGGNSPIAENILKTRRESGVPEFSGRT
jgi:hypothetical protein